MSCSLVPNCSNKSVIIFDKAFIDFSFQMYDEKMNASNFSKIYKPYILPHYQPHLIQIPLALFIGEKDTIPHTDSLLGQVPKASFVHREPDYEHLDFIWAKNANSRIWPKVLEQLKENNKKI